MIAELQVVDNVYDVKRSFEVFECIYFLSTIPSGHNIGYKINCQTVTVLASLTKAGDVALVATSNECCNAVMIKLKPINSCNLKKTMTSLSQE